MRIQDYDDTDFDPFATFNRAQGAEAVVDPYPLLHELRARGAVQPGDVREPFGAPLDQMMRDLPSYMLFGYDAVHEVLGDSATYSSALFERIMLPTFGRVLPLMDAPEHPRYRRLFQQAFLPGVVAKWGESLVPRVVNRFIDRFAGRGRAELVGEFTEHYPFHFIYGQLELPEDELQIFHKLTVGLMCITIDYAHAVEASRKMGDYLQLLVDERRSAGGDDLVSRLANAEVEGERLPDEIVVSFLRILMNAGGDTTYRGTSNLLVGLLTHPGQLEAVCKDRSLIPQAIEEALRWNCPVMTLTRMPVRDVTIAGVDIAKGTKLDVVLGSANRDPSRFPNPDRFDIFRGGPKHKTFGFGPHVCLGQHLARVEMTRALNALLDRLPNLRLDPDYPPPQIRGLGMRAPQEIRVRFG
jgi:cytochrome P450